MKKFILPLILLAGALKANAQCVPGAIQGTGSSYILPDSATNLIDACPGTAYEQILYLKVAADTTITVTTPIAATLTADIDSFVISSSIVGLPSFLTVTSVPAPRPAFSGNPKTNFIRLVVAGDSIACVRISGNVPLATPPGTNPLLISVRAYLSNIQSPDAFTNALIPNIFPGRKVDTVTTLNDYRIIVQSVPCTPASISDLSKYQFELIGAVPNPADDRTQIVFNSTKMDNYTLKVVNVTGEVIVEKKIKSTLGLNYIPVDASTWSKGIYMYSLSDGRNMISNKLQLR